MSCSIPGLCSLSFLLPSQKLKDNCDPVYEETFEYRGPLSESRLRTLEVLVVSKKTFARNPVLGMVGYPKRVEDV